MSAGEIRGRTDYELFDDEMAETLHANDRKVLESGASLRWEDTIFLDDGPHVYAFHKFPLKDPQGTAFATCNMASDVTQPRRTEEELRQTKEQYQNSIESMVAGFLRTDPVGRVVAANPAKPASWAIPRRRRW